MMPLSPTLCSIHPTLSLSHSQAVFHEVFSGNYSAAQKLSTHGSTLAFKVPDSRTIGHKYVFIAHVLVSVSFAVMKYHEQ